MDIASTLKDAVAAGDVPGVAAAAATDKGVIFTGSAGSLKPTNSPRVVHPVHARKVWPAVIAAWKRCG